MMHRHRWAKTFIVQLLLVAVMAVSAQAASVAYIRGAFQPWGQTTNEQAMTAVFGAVGVGWDDLRMSSGPGPFLPGSGYAVIFLEGSDDTALELNGYLTANLPAIQSWVQNGGRLLLNSAPNEGGNINFGFGGVTLNYDDLTTFVDQAEAVNPAAHPIFQGPFLPVGTTWTGTSFGHATVSGGAIVPLISEAGNPGKVALAELAYGSGLVLFGGMTTTNFHDPDPNAFNLRANILSYINATTAGIPSSLTVRLSRNIYLAMGDKISVSWGNSATAGSTYQLERSANGGAFTRVYEGTGNSITFLSTKVPKGQHVYRVRAIHAGYAPSGWRTAVAGFLVR